MKLAIVATPPLAIVSILTATVALWPRSAPRPVVVDAAPVPQSLHVTRCPLRMPLSCDQAHRLIVHGHVTGGPSRLQLAGPVLSTDVTTDDHGHFSLDLPVDGNLCELMSAPTDYEFSDGSMHVRYTVDFAR